MRHRGLSPLAGHCTAWAGAWATSRQKLYLCPGRNAPLLGVWSRPCWLRIVNNYTDYWGAYTRHLDPEEHTPGKRNTQKIEWKHLTLRTRMKRLVRKTICFSKGCVPPFTPGVLYRVVRLTRPTILGEPYDTNRTCLPLAVLPHGAESWSCAWQRWKVTCLYSHRAAILSVTSPMASLRG